MKDSTTLIIIPTYNERENIVEILTKLSEVRLVKKLNFHVLVVDDNSPDNTTELARTLKYPWLFVLDRYGERGLGQAYKFGFAWALSRGYAYALEMDADGSHRAEDLHLLLEADSKFDLVIGSRWIRGGKIENWSQSRKLLSKCGNFYSQLLLGIPVYDSTSGFRRISSRALSQLDLSTISSKGYGFQIEIAFVLFALDMQIKEIPITFLERTRGQSKMSLTIAIEAWLKITRLGFRRILRN